MNRPNTANKELNWIISKSREHIVSEEYKEMGYTDMLVFDGYIPVSMARAINQYIDGKVILSTYTEGGWDYIITREKIYKGYKSVKYTFAIKPSSAE